MPSPIVRAAGALAALVLLAGCASDPVDRASTRPKIVEEERRTSRDHRALRPAHVEWKDAQMRAAEEARSIASDDLEKVYEEAKGAEPE